jgi:hypothetical protein
MMIIARIISAVMATGVVFVTFVIGKMLFDKPSAYLAALFLSVSMSFVGVAHFATVDSPATFWYWLSCLFALLMWKRGDRVWYALAAITAGFAIGIKVDRLVILLPLLLAHFLRREGLGLRRLLTLGLLIPAGYLLANPVLFTSPFEFMDGFTRDMFYQALKGRGPEGSTYLQVLHDMRSGLGWPLFALASFGLAYAFYNLASSKNSRSMLWILSTFLPYYLIFGSTSVQSYYLTCFFPALMILAAYGCVSLVYFLPRHYVFVAHSIVAGVVLYSLMYTVAIVVQFSNDSRYLAAGWIDRNVPANSTVEIGERGPVVPEEKYNIINSLRDSEAMDFARKNSDNLEHYEPYRKVRRFILAIERWAGHNFGFEVRKQTYSNWFDQGRRFDTPSADLQSSIHRPDYIVLIEDLYERKIRDLMLPNSGYRLAAKYQFADPLGLQPDFPFVNRPIYIFQRMVVN